MLAALIGTLITGTIIGYGGRMVLPGAQAIGLPKTIGLGVVSALIVGLLLGSVNWLFAVIMGSLVAAGVLWVSIRQGWVHA